VKAYTTTMFGPESNSIASVSLSSSRGDSPRVGYTVQVSPLNDSGFQFEQNTDLSTVRNENNPGKIIIS